MFTFRYYNSHIPKLYLTRFLLLLLHLIILIVIFFDRDGNVKSSLPYNYSDADYQSSDGAFLIWLGLSAGFLIFEFLFSLVPVSSMVIFQSFISILTHSIAVLLLFPFTVDKWSYDSLRWIFGFCTVIPSVFELITLIEIAASKKTYPKL